MKSSAKTSLKVNQKTETSFDPFRLISDDEFNRNLNLLIAYYQMSKGETKRRFTGSEADETFVS